MIAEEIYLDPSALARLYLHQAGSREMVAWRRRVNGALPVTHHGRTEVINAIASALFRDEISPSECELAYDYFDADFTNGLLARADVLWRAALNRAAALSRTHTPTLGTRASDVLHVACALELGTRQFLTFDERQGKLAAAVGMKMISV